MGVQLVRVEMKVWGGEGVLDRGEGRRVGRSLCRGPCHRARPHLSFAR